MNMHTLSLDGTRSPTIKPSSRWRRFVDRHLPSAVIYLMVLTLVAVVLFPYVVVTVPSGHVGVLWERFGGGTVLDPRALKDEGLHLIWPWDELFMYDLRLQAITETYDAISSDGVSLSASVNARYRLQRNGVGVLHKAIGPNYLKLIAQPGIGSLTREVIAQYTAEQVYSTARQEIQDKIRQRTLEKASERMMGASRCRTCSSSMTRSCTASSCRRSWSMPSTAKPSSTTFPRNSGSASSASGANRTENGPKRRASETSSRS